MGMRVAWWGCPLGMFYYAGSQRYANSLFSLAVYAPSVARSELGRMFRLDPLGRAI